MFYLVAVILLNTLISGFFKLFNKYRINALQAIVVNYWVCVITGSIFLGKFTITSESIHTAWFPWSIFMGLYFVAIFNLIAYSTRINGITTTVISNKLSLVLPVAFSVLLYHDNLTLLKIAGIIMAFPAVYLTTRAKEEGHMQSIFWTVVLFFSSGFLDTLVKYVQQGYLTTPDTQAAYTIHTFAAAASFGTIFITLLVLLKKTQLAWRNIIAGIIVGIPNFFSIYWLIRMLNSNFLQSSAAIPINNIAIVITTCLMAIIFFKEKLTTQRTIGLSLSIIAILLIALADMNGSSI